MSRTFSTCLVVAGALTCLADPVPVTGALAAVRPFASGWLAESRGSKPAGVQVHETQGVIREISANRRKAVIRHEAIPGYMPAMTMELTVRDPAELKEVRAGDVVRFRLHADEERHWIDGVHKIGTSPTESKTAPEKRSGTRVKALKAGDVVPGFGFLDESGAQVTLQQLRGEVIALTFIFTRCPLPDFCPKMNRSFADARSILLSDPAGPSNWRFLSLSFDWEFDKPAMLSGHARAYRGTNPDRWTFGVIDPATLNSIAPRFDLMVRREGSGISHNLRTVVIDGTGKIHRQFDHNEWTSESLAAAMREAAGKGGPDPAAR